MSSNDEAQYSVNPSDLDFSEEMSDFPKQDHDWATIARTIFEGNANSVEDVIQGQPTEPSADQPADSSHEWKPLYKLPINPSSEDMRRHRQTKFKCVYGGSDISSPKFQEKQSWASTMFITQQSNRDIYGGDIENRVD